MHKNASNSLCVLPWIHSYVNSNGAYQICCTADEYHTGIPDKNGVNYNISDRPSLDDVMNSELMKTLRKKMLNGEISEACTRCIQTEKLGGVSRRILANKEHSTTFKNLSNLTNHDGKIKLELKSLDYRLGNLCNLQCRMCGPFSSSNWVKDWNEVMPTQEHLNPDQISYYQNFNWIEKEFLIEEFEEKIHGVEQIHFAGGEPLLSPQMSKVLKKCIELNLAKNISISYNTNVTVLPKEVLNLWKEFKEIKLLCSVDGFKDVNDYIRFPAKWNIIDSNLEYLDHNAQSLKITEIMLSCTVQIYNVLSLNDLYDYLKKFHNIIPALNLINLHFPDYMSTKALPREAKDEASKRLLVVAKELEKRVNNSHLYLIENIYQTINFMNEEDLTNKLMTFKSVNNRIDTKKKFKMAISLPELNSYLINFYINSIPEN